MTTGYGTWPTPLTPEAIAAASLRLGAPYAADDGAVYWTESRPDRGGRNVLVRELRGAQSDVGPAEIDVRTRVHEYGGRGFGVDRHGRVVLSDPSSGRLHLVSPDGTWRPLTEASTYRFAEPLFDLLRDRILAVGERHVPGARLPENLLVEIDLHTGRVAPLVTGRDFYAAPELSADGQTLAYLAWDHPYMPWDAAEAHVATLGPDGRPTGSRHVAGDRAGAAFQPTFAPDGRLYLTLETGDRFQLHRIDAGGPVRVLHTEAELFLPLWQLGTRVFGFTDARTVVVTGVEQGASRLLRADVDTGEVETLDDGFGLVTGLAVQDGAAWLTRGFGASLVRYDLATRTATVRRSQPALLDEADISVAEPVRFATSEGGVAYGFFYAPKRAGFAGAPGTLPPLMVMAHGGPTGGASPVTHYGIQQWTTRGWAVLDVNYRGSTGFGRAYRERLHEQWGVLDVDDCVAGARAMAAEGRVDPERLAIRGQSAGGYTVLRALSEHRVFHSGACLYGISDLEALTRGEHKFEAYYDRTLVGPYPEGRARFVERSPIHHPERISAPVVFFQGLEDKAVPPAQTRAIYEAVLARGLDTGYHAYPGEGHGFRDPKNVRHALETELAFHRRVLKLG